MIRFAVLCFILVFPSCTKVETESPFAVSYEQQGTMMELPWQFSGDQGERFLSDVWDIKTTLKYDHIVSSLPMFYDALIQRYTTAFGDFPYPTKRMDVFLFATEDQWRIKMYELLGAEAKQWFKLESGGITIDGTAVLYHLDRRGRSRVTLRIAAHEGWHQYAETTFKASLPTWLDEGIGTWMEGFRLRRGSVQFTPRSNWDRLTTLRTIVQSGRMYTLEELMQSEPSELLADSRNSLLGYYAQLWGLVSFIIEYEDGKYFPALQHILQTAVDGTIHVPYKGWLFCFAEEPAEFEREYKEWVVDYVRPGGSWR